MTPDGSVQIFADALRITALDPNGFPAIGNAVYVTNAMVHATMTPEVETGDDIVTKNAAGDIAARFKHGDMIKYYGVSLELTQPDEMIEQLLTGGVIYTDSTAALSTPVAPTLAAGTGGGGTLATGSYQYRYTALSAYGETLPSPEAGVAAAVTGPTGKVTLTLTAVSGAVGYRIYGRTAAAEQFIAQVGAVTTYVDLGTITPNGVMPTANTTAGPGVNVGMQSPALGIVGNPNGVSLEMWGKSILNGQFKDPLGYRRWVWPLCTNFRPDARAFDNVQLANVFLGQAFENTNWGTGPFGDWPFDSTKVWQRARCSRLLIPSTYLGSVPATV